MFQRIVVEEWQRVLSVLSILIFLASFLVITVRAMRMPKRKLQHLESLPLADDTHPHERTR
jgi:hypothetical protein